LIHLAIFGSPVEHSLSPWIHSRFARQAGIRIDYAAVEADSDSFPSLVRDFVRRGGRGCNITVPLKQVAWQLARSCSDNARRARAVNTLTFEESGEWVGDNTDGQGLVDDLLALSDCRLEGARLCLLGAGGAAAGVLASLLQCGPAEVVIVNRSRERAEELAERHRDLGTVSVREPVEGSDSGPYDLLINATSLGHSGGAPEVSGAWFKPRGVCYDMNYGLAARPLRQLCDERGIRYRDGLGMLVGQAALSFRIWTGYRPESAPVLGELRDHLGKQG
jgi:shikimate dehydrogenase